MIVWSNGGRVGATLFSGLGAGLDFPIPIPAGWTFEGLGSMTGGLWDDFVVRDASGQHAAFPSLGFLPQGAFQLGPPSKIGPPNGAVVEQVGDFDGDGNLDWLLANLVSRGHEMWFLDGAFKQTSSGVLPYVPMN